MSNQALTQLTTTATVESGDLLYVVRSGTTDLALTGAGVLAQFLTPTGNGSNLAGITQSQVSGLLITSRPNFANVQITGSVLTYAASVVLDFDGDGFQTVTLAGVITFTTSNLAAVRSKTIRIIGDGSNRALTFPAGWKFVGSTEPTELASGKTALLALSSFGTTDADVLAAYAVEQ